MGIELGVELKLTSSSLLKENGFKEEKREREREKLSPSQKSFVL